jgi:hypothetical protein
MSTARRPVATDGLPELDYPLHDDLRRVDSSAMIQMPDGVQCYLTAALIGQTVGIVTFATLHLGYYDERDKGFTEMEANFNNAEPISPL